MSTGAHGIRMPWAGGTPRHDRKDGGHVVTRVTTFLAVATDVIPPPVKTPSNDGKADRVPCPVQFELLARAGGWSSEVKALQHAMCLSGDTLSSLLPL